jgi:hypothetical protein
MKKNFAVFTVAGALMLPGLAFAQQSKQGPPPGSTPTATDQDIQLLREDIRSEKKQLVAANMQLTDAEAAKFWPVYDAYTVENTKIGDTRLALINEYAQTYDTMTDAQAKSLVKRSEGVDQQTVALRAQWMPKFEAVLPGKKAALFYQLDRRIQLLLDLQLASGIPMVKQ